MTSLVSPNPSAVNPSANPSRTTVPGQPPDTSGEVTWTSVVTLLVWSGCVLVGGLGLVLPYRKPAEPVASPAPPVTAEMIRIELTPDPAPLLVTSTPPASTAPPPLPAAVAPPAAPTLLAVAEPSPLIAFALPIEGPSVVVEASAAAPRTAPVELGSGGGTASSGVAIGLTYGRGEGRQPAPEYPRAARRSGQEGTVGVVFQVGVDGRVLSAEATSPSPWPVLNEAAVRVIRERWRFPPGAVRRYQVDIRFQLQE